MLLLKCMFLFFKFSFKLDTLKGRQCLSYSPKRRHFMFIRTRMRNWKLECFQSHDCNMNWSPANLNFQMPTHCTCTMHSDKVQTKWIKFSVLASLWISRHLLFSYIRLQTHPNLNPFTYRPPRTHTENII